jgi:hypothetical protein
MEGGRPRGVSRADDERTPMAGRGRGLMGPLRTSTPLIEGAGRAWGGEGTDEVSVNPNPPASLGHRE